MGIRNAAVLPDPNLGNINKHSNNNKTINSSNNMNNNNNNNNNNNSNTNSNDSDKLYQERVRLARAYPRFRVADVLCFIVCVFFVCSCLFIVCFFVACVFAVCFGFNAASRVRSSCAPSSGGLDIVHYE